MKFWKQRHPTEQKYWKLYLLSHLLLGSASLILATNSYQNLATLTIYGWAALYILELLIYLTLRDQYFK